MTQRFSQHGTAGSFRLRWLISLVGHPRWVEGATSEGAGRYERVSPPTGLIHLGLDTSKNAIAVGILRSDEVSPDVEKIFNDEASIRRLIDRFADRGVLRVCYEAGPTGFGL